MKNRCVVMWLLLALGVLAAGCSGSDETVATVVTPVASSAQTEPGEDAGDDSAEQPTGQDDGDVFEIPNEIRDVTAETLNVSKGSVQFNDPFPLANSGCFLQTAYSAESTAFGLSFGVLATGEVIAPGAGAVQSVLDSCDAAGAALTADEWAELVVRLDETPLLVQVMIETLRFAAEDMGATWEPPAITTDGDTSTLHFFAYGTDFGDAFDVTVTRSGDGTVNSQYDLLRPGG